MKCIIMAGGRGTRLWPVSRNNKPKQFQCLISKKTMLQETVLRMRAKFDLEDIFISTNKEYEGEVRNEIPELPVENLILEPISRGSASSIALTIAILTAKKIDESIVFVPSDHIIKNPDKLIASLSDADNFLKENKNYIITFGIEPTFPETGFGYIEKGELKKKYNSGNVFEVKHFTEKPDAMTAKDYLDKGDFFWNSAIYVCRADVLVEKFKKYIPDTYNRIIRIKDSVGTSTYEKILMSEYPEMDKIDFAYGIIENDPNIAFIPLKINWSDVGSWSALKKIFTDNNKDHYVKGEHIDFNSENLLIYGSKKLITTVGVKNLVIVDTDDVILVCDSSQSQMVGAIVERLEKEGKIKLL